MVFSEKEQYYYGKLYKIYYKCYEKHNSEQSRFYTCTESQQQKQIYEQLKKITSHYRAYAIHEKALIDAGYDYEKNQKTPKKSPRMKTPKIPFNGKSPRKSSRRKSSKRKSLKL